jgi:hypothetical protein
MNGNPGSRQWVRIHLSSLEEIPALRNTYQAEVFRSTVRRIDDRNMLIEAFVPESMIAKLQAKHPVRVLGDVDRMTRDAARHVSKVNRYRQS